MAGRSGRACARAPSPPCSARRRRKGWKTALGAPAREAAAESPAEAAEAPRKVPSPQERLRHAFSSDLPENLMAPPSVEPAAVEYGNTRAGTAPAPSASRSCASSASAAAASTPSTA